MEKLTNTAILQSEFLNLLVWQWLGLAVTLLSSIIISIFPAVFPTGPQKIPLPRKNSNTTQK